MIKSMPCADVPPPSHDIRTDSDVNSIKRAFADNLFYLQGKFPSVATPNDLYMALAYTVRDRLVRRWILTIETYFRHRSRTVCYLSAEYLLGPHLANNLINLGIMEEVRTAMSEMRIDLDGLLDQEEEPGLGNGGLGRLAACFLDSLATLQIPAIGYGIRYEFGIFDQIIRSGWQVEMTDKWLRFGNPWELVRPEITYDVGFGGYTESVFDDKGFRVRWHPGVQVRGVACDTPILGYRVGTANFLRLWKAEACESFDFHAFNAGDYYGAVEAKVFSENITKILYPNDEALRGKELRLRQQFFFVSCSLQDMIRIHLQTASSLEDFGEKYAIQLNDTHPSIGIVELMRLLVDVHGMEWDQAWTITSKAFAYTNHTLLPEALERWSVVLIGHLLPRHLEIIYEINRRFLDEVRNRFPENPGRIVRLSLIDETGERYVRMANLAVVGSHAVNGVSQLHTDLLKKEVLSDFHEMWPEKFSNKTNGVTPRRFLVLSNPGLTELISSRIGTEWISNLTQLERLLPLAENPHFRDAWDAVKYANKARLAAEIARRTGVSVDPGTMYDIQVKRIHEYKRQHLNILHVITLYNRLRHRKVDEFTPRTVLFGGKAAPGYAMAKLMIRLIHGVADRINNDSAAAGKLRVVFFPDFNVRATQVICPAADLSEQISLAGKEASGTGNMKLAMNGALTIGTLDGANVEIVDRVGVDNFYLFGLTADQVRETKRRGYFPRERYDADSELRQAVDDIAGGEFSNSDIGLFRPLVDSLLYEDTYMVLADYRDYVQCQERAAADYLRPELWTRKAILNVANMGHFSSDRTISEYAQDIWRVKPVIVPV